MIELPDDELDKLFRKSSEELDPTYEPADWNALSKRLDQEDGRTPAAWLRKWWPVGLLALMLPVGLGSYFLLKDADSDKNVLLKNNKSVVAASKPQGNKVSDNKASVENLNKKNESGSKNSSETDARSAVEVEKKQSEASFETTEENKKSHKELSEKNQDESEKESLLETNKKLIVKSEKIKRSDKEVPRSSKILPRSRTKAGGVYLEPNRSTGQEGDGAFSSHDRNAVKARAERAGVNQLKEAVGSNELYNKTHSKNINPDYQDAVISANETKNATGEPLNANVISEPKENRLLLSVAYLNHLPFSNKGNLMLPEVKTVHLPVVETLEEADQKEEFAKLAIRVGYSPDLTTVGLKNFTKPGSAFSIMAEYALMRKLFIQTGLTRSVKDYYANASEYDLMPYVTNINTPYNVDGTCNMLEIPLNIRYDIAQGQHSRWFAGTGFTSYNIQKEKYVYNYKTYKHGQKPGWEGKTGWYLFSHLNASVGYERRITRKFSILAEPYIRIPLKGVGYGKVNLVTTGMWLSIRYTPYFFK